MKTLHDVKQGDWVAVIGRGTNKKVVAAIVRKVTPTQVVLKSKNKTMRYRKKNGLLVGNYQALGYKIVAIPELN